MQGALSIRTVTLTFMRILCSVLFTAHLSCAAGLPSEKAGAGPAVNSAQDYWGQVESLYMSSFGYKNWSVQKKQDNESNQFIWSYLFDALRPTANLDERHAKHTMALLKDLRVLCGVEKSQQVTLMQALNRSHTFFGTVALVYQLANPTTDTTLLLKRQNSIRALVDNPQLLADCKKALIEIQKIQQDLLTLIALDQEALGSNSLYAPVWSPYASNAADDMLKSVAKKMYSTVAAYQAVAARKVNNSEIGLDAWLWWKKLWAFWPLGLQVGALGLMHAFSDPTVLTTQQSVNNDLANSVDTLEGFAQLDQSEWDSWWQAFIPRIKPKNTCWNRLCNTWKQWWNIPDLAYVTPPQDKFMGALVNNAKTLQSATGVGVEANSLLGVDPSLVRTQALVNAWNADNDLKNLKPYWIRVFSSVKAMGNMMFNPRHPSQMTWMKRPLMLSEYNTWWGYFVTLVNMGIIGNTFHTLLKYSKNVINEQTETVNKLRQCLLALSDFESQRDALYTLIAQHDALLDGLSSNSKQALSGASTSDSLNRLFRLVSADIFDKKVGFFTLGVGKILASYKLLQETKNEFKTLFRGIGELDLIVSLASLYQEHRSAPVEYSFAHYVSTQPAYLKLVDIWNPFINPQEAVPNNVTIGDPGAYTHMLLTGSNTGGKSTLLRAIGITALLAQTIGMVPALHAELTPFQDIVVLLNVSDDPAAQESTFAAEGSRARELLQRIDALSPDDHALIFIDELFKGTDHNEGLKWASAVTRYIDRSPKHLVSFFATHFHELTHLESVTNGRYKNYRMDADKHTRGGYSRTYKLQEGPCQVNIASEIMRDKLQGFALGDVDKDFDELLLPH